MQAADHHTGMSIGQPVSGQRDGEMEGWMEAEEGRITGATQLHCVFFKDIAFFDDYFNPTKDLSAWTGGLIYPPQSFSH